MFDRTDHSNTHPDVLRLMPGNAIVIDVDPPANLVRLEDAPDFGGDGIVYVGEVLLTEASLHALDQLRRDDMRTFKDFDDFEGYVRNR